MMLTNQMCGETVPQMGMGTMRLPVVDGDDKNIDEEQVQRMVKYALDHGCNYFDTGYSYHGGNSEVVIGKTLAAYPRDSYMLADKFPGYMRDSFGRVEEIFEEQLQRCGVDYFDFYLLHNVCEMNIELYLNEDKYHTVEYLLKQKESGRIKHLGFSAHASLPTLQRFLSKFSDQMEFGQLQVNWMDWEFQNAKEKVEMLRSHNLPIIVMEPLRGGRLAKLSNEMNRRLTEVRLDATPAEWGMRFVQNMPGVALVLSGGSSSAHVVENMRIFEDTKELNSAERQILKDMGKELAAIDTVPCTKCRYCISHCPQYLDIPELIALYNEHQTIPSGKGFIAPMALGGMDENRRPSACIGCGKCSAVCPQEIDIPGIMRNMRDNISVW